MIKMIKMITDDLRLYLLISRLLPVFGLVKYKVM